MAFPAILLAITVMAIFGSGLGVLIWPSASSTCRSSRASCGPRRWRRGEQLFVEAARARGASRLRCAPARAAEQHRPVVVQASILLGIASCSRRRSELHRARRPAADAFAGPDALRGRDFMANSTWVVAAPRRGDHGARPHLQPDRGRPPRLARPAGEAEAAVTALLEIAQLTLATARRRSSATSRSARARRRPRAWWASRAPARRRSAARCSGCCPRRPRSKGRASLRGSRPAADLSAARAAQPARGGDRRRLPGSRERARSLLHVGDQLVEAFQSHLPISRRARGAEALAWLREVGIAAPELRMKAYPHELSGGMNQRVAIAIATRAQPGADDRRRANVCARRHRAGSDPASAPLSHRASTPVRSS